MSHNYIEDNFEDKIVGIFPAGWLSGVHPLNIKVVDDNGNNVMQVRDTTSDDVTEVERRFKKTTTGVIECKVKALDLDSGFFIHLVQLDREYNPFDDIIIGFDNGNIHVIGEENIVTINKSDVEDTNWYDFLYPDSDVIWLIDENDLEDYDPVANYTINEWISIKIEFNRNEFILTINENSLGVFSYPLYNPPYFAGLYFWSFIKPSSFKFYVDDVKITLSQPVDYIHPANIVFMVLILISIIVIYIRFQKRKTKRKRR